VTITWSPLALERLAEITETIAAHRPEAAEDLIEEIFAAVDRLRDFPEIGREVPEFERSNLRELICRKYRIIYQNTGQRLEILTVRHSLQHLDKSDLAE
jgi:plasmid stabilization system protein ParE